MKVLILHPRFYVYGGAERLIVRLANHLTDNGIENTILTSGMIPTVREDLKETRLVVVDNPHQLIYHILHRFDVVNAHNNPTQLFTYPRHKPLVWMCNEPPIEILRGEDIKEIEKEIVRNHVDISVVADHFNAKRFEKIYGVRPRINPYGIDYDFFKEGNPEKAKKRYGLDGKFVILHVGMFTFTKNQLRSAKIFKEIKKEVFNAKLVFVGYDKGAYKQQVESYLLANGLYKDVVFTGEIPQAELRDIYHASDVVISPILSQGGWLSAFEAIAANKTIIVSPEMTASDIIKKNKLGVVTDDFVKAIKKVYDGSSSRHVAPWVGKNLNWNKFCNNMVKYFEEVRE